MSTTQTSTPKNGAGVAAPSTELSILVPVLNRPANVSPLLDDIALSTGSDVEVVFIATIGDTDELVAISHEMERDDIKVELLTIPAKALGDYARKINTGIRRTTSEWIFMGADDLHFKPGWFGAAKLVYESTGKLVIGTQDLGNSRVLRGEHSTHTLVHRSYVARGTIDNPNKVLHEGYPHEFVDDEFIETAKKRDEFVFAHNSVVEHLHPLWGKAPTDALYDGHRKRMNNGRRIYMKRRRLWR